MSAGKIRIAFVFLIWLLNYNLTDLSHLLLCVPGQGMCLCFLKCSRLLESGNKSIPGTLLLLIHQTVKIKVGDKIYYVRFEKHFPLTKQNLCFPPTPNLLIVQMLDCSRKLLLLSQIFHSAACWLKAAAAACSAEVCAKESELFEYLPVRFPLPFSKGFGAHVVTNWRSFELLRCLVGRLSLLESSRLEFTLEQLIMVHMPEGHPPCQNGQIGQISSLQVFFVYPISN